MMTETHSNGTILRVVALENGRAIGVVEDAPCWSLPSDQLFLGCLTDVLEKYGVTPPPQLGLPRSIGKVVEYDHVKRLMFTRMLCEDANTEAGKKRHRDRVQQANKRARQAMMHIKVVGCDDPFIWLTGERLDTGKAA